MPLQSIVSIETLREERQRRAAEIDLIVVEVEQSKQIHLSEEERAALIVDLSRTGESIATIRQWGENVKRSTTFGKVSLDLWLESVKLFTAAELEGEIKRRFSEMIERNRAAFIQIHDESFYEAWIDHLEREGLRSAQQMADRRVTDLKNKVTKAVDERIRSARRFILKCSESAKDELYQALVVKYGRFKDDHVRKNLQVCAPFLLDEIEEMKKRMPEETTAGN